MLPDMRSSTSCTRAVTGSESECALRYKGTFDVFYKVAQQVRTSDGISIKFMNLAARTVNAL